MNNPADFNANFGFEINGPFYGLSAQMIFIKMCQFLLKVQIQLEQIIQLQFDLHI